MLNDTNRKRLDDIVAQMAAQDATVEDVRAIVDDFKSKYDTPEQQQQQVISQETKPTQAEKYGVAGALFPATTKATERGGGFVPRVIAGAGDALTLPMRAASAVSTGAGYVAGGGGIKGAAHEAFNDLSKTESDEKGIVGFAQNVALDPTSSPLIIAASGPVKAVKAARAAPTIGKALLRAGAQGAGEGAYSALYNQSKDGKISIPQTIAQTAVGFATGAGATGLGKAVKKGLGKLFGNSAIRNIDISLRPGQYGRKIGYDHNNVVKHDLIGTPRETFEAATSKLDDLQNRAVEIGRNSPETFNVDDIFEKAKRSIDPQKHPEEYARQIDLLDNSKKAYIKTFGKVVDAPTAMKIRTRIGDKSAFVGRTTGGAKIDPDADWKEDAYNEVYFKIKNELHDKLGGELKDINKAQSEIIPIKQVAERRMPISESNQRIGLSDLLTTQVGQTIGQTIAGGAAGAGIGAGTSENRAAGALKGLAIGAALAGGRRALGSPAATKAYYNLSKKLAPEAADLATSVANRMRRGAIPDVPELKTDIPSVETIPPDLHDELNIPAYKRKGIDIEGRIEAEKAARIEEQARKYRVTPEQYQSIEADIINESAATVAAKEADDIAASKAREAAIEQEIYLENLEKKPVITIDEMRKKEQLKKMQQGKVAKKTKGNQPGDVAAWHKLVDNPTIGEVVQPKKKGGLLGNDRGAVGEMYHGTSSQKEFDKFSDTPTYITTSKKDAKLFAENPIVGGSRGRGSPKVAHIDADEIEKVRDINSKVEEAVFDGDIDDVIAEEVVKAKKDGIKYLKFKHPGVDEDFDAYVAVDPNNLKIKKWESIGSALKNKRGAVGGASNNITGIPAIRDPETGKIYLGGWRGHKDAITKGETSAVQERLKYEHFLDNSDKPTNNVGFIDKKGNFVTRAEAEKEIARPKTPAMIYHGDEWGKAGSKGDKNSALKTLAATGATAGAGLTGITIAEALKSKKKQTNKGK